jgi:DNA-binding beta-propeller fold protein YncE
VYVSNVTTDNVNVYQVCTVPNATCSSDDVADAKMDPAGSPVSVGLDPMAMTVDPTKNFLYVVNHGSSTVSGFRINPSSGALSALNPATASTGASPVAVTMHSSGKFLFVSNNASSNVSGFNVSTTNGALSTAINVTSSAQPAGLVAK